MLSSSLTIDWKQFKLSLYSYNMEQTYNFSYHINKSNSNNFRFIFSGHRRQRCYIRCSSVNIQQMEQNPHKAKVQAISQEQEVRLVGTAHRSCLSSAPGQREWQINNNRGHMRCGQGGVCQKIGCRAGNDFLSELELWSHIHQLVWIRQAIGRRPNARGLQDLRPWVLLKKSQRS